jgi:hypothetical protein
MYRLPDKVLVPYSISSINILLHLKIRFVFCVQAKGGTISSYGKPSQIASTVCP